MENLLLNTKYKYMDNWKMKMERLEKFQKYF